MQRHWPWYLLITTAILLVFGQSLLFEFVQWDDLALIVRNRYVNPPTWAAAASAWVQPDQKLYIPVTYNVWAAIATLAGTESADSFGERLNPYLYHAANVLLHICAGCLVYRILLLIIRRAWIAAMAALLWAVHPFQAEPVSWATGMKDVLSGVLALAAMLCYLSTAASSPRTRLGAWGGYVGAALLMMLATLAKPGVVAVPLLAITLDLLILMRPWRQVLACALPLVLSVVPAVVVTALVQDVESADITPLWTRPLIAGHALATYLQKTIWPNQFATDYGLTPRHVLASGWGYVAWVVPLLGAAAVVWYRPGRRWLGASALVFLLGLAPVLGLAPFTFQAYSTVADRYVYLSLLGVALAAAYFLNRLPVRWGATFAGFVCALLMLRCAIQVSTWRDDQTLCPHTWTVNPRSWVSRHHLASWYLGEAKVWYEAMQREKDPATRQQYRELWLANDHRSAELYRQSLEHKHDNLFALNNLAMYHVRLNQFDQAVEVLEKAIEEIEKNPRIKSASTDERLTVAAVCMQLKQYERAEKHIRDYLRSHPDDPKAKAMLEQALGR